MMRLPFGVRSGLLIAGLWLVGASAMRAQPAGGRPAPGRMPSSVAGDVDVEWGVRVPLRDGVTLHATVYRPVSLARRGQRLPIIVTMTPYTSDSYHDRGMYFARHGYLFAVVDVRGRGNSEGRYAPFEQDGRDGADAVEWLARLPGCDGQAAMWGGSYAGFAQWATAKERPPALKTIVPAAAVYPGHDFPTLKGLTYLSSLFWLAGTAGRTANSAWEGDADYWLTRSARAHQLERSLRALDTLSGFPSALWQQWLDHPTFDGFWQRMVPDSAAYAQLDLPILTITGYYDVDQPGALRYYREHQAWGSPAARARHALLLGPWDHAGTRTPTRSFAGLTMGPASLLDLPALHVAWYDHVLKGAPRPAFLSAPVRYYRPETDRWSSAPSLAALTRRTDTVYLQPGQAAARWRTPGRLTSRPAAAPWSRALRLDLRAPDALAADHAWDPFHYASAGRLQSLGDGALVFEWRPPAGGHRLAGRFAFTATISCDDDATDLSVDLYLVDGTQSPRWLTGDLLRTPCRSATGEPVRIRLADFPVTATRVAAPDRLRLVLSTPSLALFEPHYGGAGATTGQTRARTRVRTITVHADGRHAPALSLPIAIP